MRTFEETSFPIQWLINAHGYDDVKTHQLAGLTLRYMRCKHIDTRGILLAELENLAKEISPKYNQLMTFVFVALRRIEPC